MMSTSLVTFSEYIIGLLKANALTLGVKPVAIFYGDQDTVPYSPTICVDPEQKTTEYAAAMRNIDVTFTTHVIIYHSQFTSAADNAVNADRLAESIETLFHTDPTCGGIVLDSHVSQIESGYAQRENTIYRASRLTCVGRSKARLPAAGWM